MMFMKVSAAMLFSTSVFAGQASFNEVLEVIRGPLPQALVTETSEQEGAAYANGGLPQYRMSEWGIFKNLAKRAFNTLKQDNDYYDRLEKQIHQNGICLAGTWEITEPSEYTGYFAQGKQALFIGRASTATNPTAVGKDRSFGFAGKLFPTLNPDEKVTTANFFTVDNLGGTAAKNFLDVALTNEPVTPGFPTRFEDAKFASLIIAALLKGAALAGDPKLGFRPVWQIAEAGLAAGEKTKSPRWIQIRATEAMPRLNEIDFRSELIVDRYADKSISLDILVSDQTKDTGNAVEEKWTRLGRIQLTEIQVSYGCDRRLHFPHPANR